MSDLTADEKYTARLIYAAGPARSSRWKKAWQDREDKSEGLRAFIERLMADDLTADATRYFMPCPVRVHGAGKLGRT